MPSRSFLFFVALSVVCLAQAANDRGKPIDTQRSSLLIHVGKAGLLSAAGHEHWVNTPIADGTLDDGSTISTVRFVVDAAKLTVLADKNLSAKELAEQGSRIIQTSQHRVPVNPCTTRRGRFLESGWEFDLAGATRC